MSYYYTDPREEIKQEEDNEMNPAGENKAKRTGDTVVWRPLADTLLNLQKESVVWRSIPTWTCKLCTGKGHTELQCGTKKNMDKVAKTVNEEQKAIWA